MFLPDKVIDRLKKRYKHNSVVTINTNIKRIFQQGLGINKFNKQVLTDRFADVKKYISGIGKISVQKSMVHNVRSIIGSKHAGYNTLVEHYNKLHKNRTQYAMPSKRSMKVYMSIEDIGRKVLEYSDFSQKGNSVKMIVASLYRYLPPLRGQDFYGTVFVKVPKGVSHAEHLRKIKKNYIDIGGWILVIGNYKTVKTHGIRRLKLHRTLVMILEKWRKEWSKDLLLVNRFGKGFSQDAFTKLLWRVYGRNFSVDMLRKIYISEMVEYLLGLGNPVETIKWRKRLAKMVGHSLEAQEFTYSSFRGIKRKKSSKAYMKTLFEIMKSCYIP